MHSWKFHTAKTRVRYRDIVRKLSAIRMPTVPSACRTIGIQCGCIVVPCHRVIASSGSLCGYGGGLDIKRKLLDLEQSGRELATRRKKIVPILFYLCADRRITFP